MEQHKCSICLKNFKIGDVNTLKTECNHCFHTSCFLKALKNKNSCPICRKKFNFGQQKTLKSDRACDTVTEIVEEFNFFEKYEHAVMFNIPDIILTQIYSFGYKIAKEIASFYELEDNYEEEFEEDDNIMEAVRNLRYRRILETESEILSDNDSESISTRSLINLDMSNINNSTENDLTENESISDINSVSPKILKKKEKIL